MLINELSQPRRYEEFIRGPIPEQWIRKAGAISTTAGMVGLILWGIAYRQKLFGRTGRRRRSNPIRLSNAMTEKYGIKRSAKLEALKKLGEAGLIRLRLKNGSSPEAMIIDDYILK